MEERSIITDYFVIVSARTAPQIRAIRLEIERVCAEHRLIIRHREGLESNTWVLLDLGDVIVHIFQEEARRYYALEKLWGECPLVPLPKT
ncbi:MAG: ribosome silencing factor [candidate division FCPU426 bacterium]